MPWTWASREQATATEVKRLSGTNEVPILVLDDGEVITGSGRIARWAGRAPGRPEPRRGRSGRGCRGRPAPRRVAVDDHRRTGPRREGDVSAPDPLRPAACPAQLAAGSSDRRAARPASRTRRRRRRGSGARRRRTGSRRRCPGRSSRKRSGPEGERLGVESARVWVSQIAGVTSVPAGSVEPADSELGGRRRPASGTTGRRRRDSVIIARRYSSLARRELRRAAASSCAGWRSSRSKVQASAVAVVSWPASSSVISWSRSSSSLIAPPSSKRAATSAERMSSRSLEVGVARGARRSPA